MNRRPSRAARLLTELGVTLALVLVLFPFVWILATSLKPAELVADPGRWVFAPTLDHWREVLLRTEVPRNILNSLIVGLCTVGIALLVGCPAAYALSRSRRSGPLRFSILSAEMMPPAILILPFFLLFYRLGLIDSLAGVVVTHLTLVVPVVTWFLIGFFDAVPRELEEQARIDGCSVFGAFFRILLPTIRPGLGAAAVFGFVLSWNDLFYALILTGGESRTLPVAIAGFWTFRGIEMGKMAVAILLAVVPVLTLSFFVQKHLVRGLGGGAIKM